MDSKKMPLLFDLDLETQTRLFQPIPRNKQQQRQAQHAVRQFTIQERLGYGPSLLCWCGNSLPLDYSQHHNMTARLNAFLDKHEACTPREGH